MDLVKASSFGNAFCVSTDVSIGGGEEGGEEEE